MIRKLLLSLVVLTCGAFGQAVRYDSIAQVLTANNLYTPVSNGTVLVYNYPGATTNCATAGTCTLATTYIDDAGITSCGTSVPLTRPTSNSCTGSTDAGANFGFWIKPGSYQYCISGTGVGTSCTNITLAANNHNIAYVDGTTDIGSQINAAYAALPANGGTIVIVPKLDNSCYAYTTPIVANVSGKYLLLKGSMAAGSTAGCLNFTPTTGSAITLDFVPTGGAGARGGIYGIQDLWLSNNLCTSIGGCGGSTTGVSITSTNDGIDGGLMQNVTISGFTVGYGENAIIPSSAVQWVNPRIYNNGVGMNLFNTAEEQIIGGTFYGNGNHIQGGDANSQPELHITGTYFIAHSNEAFDFTRDTNLAATMYLTDVHLENGANGTSNAHYIEGNVLVFGKGGVAEDDSSSGTSDWWFKPNGAAFMWDSLELVTGSRNPTIGVLNLAANTRTKLTGFVVNPATLTAIVGGANAAKATICLLSGNLTNTASACKIENPLQDNNGVSYTKATASGAATVDLASVASGACTADSSDVTLTGAAVGDPVRVVAGTALPAGVWLIGRVTASNTGRFQLCNLSGGAVDRASDTYTLSVVK